jgi:hypothetical protein
MAGKSIGGSRMQWLLDGLEHLNSGKILTFTKAMSIKNEKKENVVYLGNPSLARYWPQSTGLGRWENEW